MEWVKYRITIYATEVYHQRMIFLNLHYDVKKTAKRYNQYFFPFLIINYNQCLTITLSNDIIIYINIYIYILRMKAM